jgi:hypothetical protein
VIIPPYHLSAGTNNGEAKKSPSVKNVGVGSRLENKWFGWKTVVYNNPNKTVTIEAYIVDTVSADGTKPSVRCSRLLIVQVQPGIWLKRLGVYLSSREVYKILKRHCRNILKYKIRRFASIQVTWFK